MKLAKKISKGIALCAALAIMGAMGGVITSCSNGSDDPNPVPPPAPEDNEDVPEGWTAITVGDIEKYDGQDGTSSYTVIKNNDGSITISHDAAMAKYASCSFKPQFGDNNTLYTKITNNSGVEATVQIQVNKAGTEANGYEPTPTITAVYVDGEKQENASAYGVELKIPANESVVIATMFDLEKNPDTVAISLNSQEGIAGTVEKGSITVSGISMKEVADESELEEEINNGNEEGEDDNGTGNEGGNGEGNGDNNEEEVKPDPANPEKVAVNVYNFGTYAGNDGEHEYEVELGDDSISISHDEAMAQYANCSLKVKDLDKYNTISVKLENKGTEDAIVQFAIQKAGTEDNGWQPTGATISGSVDGKDPSEGSGDWGVKTKIGKGESQTVQIKFDSSKAPDEIAVSLNSGDTENTIETGSITISEAYMWKAE